MVALIHLGGDQLVGFTAEGQIWDTGLRPVQGLHHRHREFVLTPEAHGGEPVEFFVEAAANPIPPWHLADWPLLLPDYRGAPLIPSRQPSWRSPTGPSRDSCSTCRSCSNWPNCDPDRSEEINRALNKARGLIDPENVSTSVVPARDVLARLLDRPTYSANTVVAVGHAHIDCAWLWPLHARRGANAPGHSPTN